MKKRSVPPPLSLVIRGKTLAILDRQWMMRHFSRRIPYWYPGMSLESVAIKDTGAYDFKKSIQYTLVLRSQRGKRLIRVLRGNVPSLDTTHEARVAFLALRRLWRYHARHHNLPLTRPLEFNARLRLLLYEEAPGVPLIKLLRQQRGTGVRWSRSSGRWLARLHRIAAPFPRRKTYSRDRREALYFRFNFYWAGKRRSLRAGQILRRYLVERRAYDKIIQQSSVLIHGDLNPANVIVDEQTKTFRIIDFGNVWCADPMSDLANTLTQYYLLHWTYKVSHEHIRDHARALFYGYTSLQTLSASDRRRFYLFSAWWSLQVLSYTLALAHFLAINLTRQRLALMTDDLCARAETALINLANERGKKGGRVILPL